MKFQLTLSEDDYLFLSLFSASHSILVKKRRRRSVIMMTVCFIVLSLFSLLGDKSYIFFSIYLVLAVAVIFLYPLRLRKVYTRYYRKFNAEQLQHRFGKMAEIEFLNNELLTKDSVGEGKADLSQLEHIYETGAYFVMKFNTAESLILPKNRIPVAHVTSVIDELIAQFHIPFTKDLEWKFK